MRIFDASVIAENDEKEESSHPRATEEVAPATSAPRLSKAWAVESAHVPIFTGGKICPCRLPQPSSSEKQTNDPEEEEEQDKQDSTIPCLLVPVNGDIAFVDSKHGIKLGSVRESVRHKESKREEDEEEDDGIDADAITAYALSMNQRSLVTCTHNHLMQQYAFDTASGGKNRISVTLQKSWGRSGHTLPVTGMEFHKSGVFVATASVDGTVRIWDARAAGHVTHVFRPIAGGSGGGSGRLSVTCIKWLECTVNLVIAIGRDDGSIAIHDLRDKDMKFVICLLGDHLSAITCMDWWWKGREEKNSSSGRCPSIFVTAGRDAVINIWQIEEADQSNNTKENKKKKSKQQVHDGDFPIIKTQVVYHRRHTLPLYEQIEGLVVLPNIKNENRLILVTAGSKGVVRMWESAMKSDGQIEAPTLSADQTIQEAYGEAGGGYLGLFCMETPTSTPASQDVHGTNKLSTTQHQLIVSDGEHSMSFVSVAGTEMATTRTVVGYNDEVLDLKVIPSSEATSEATHIVVATNSAQVRIFDLSTFSCDLLDHHNATVLCVDVSPCGRYIATCGKDKKMCLWHTKSRKCVATAVGHTEAVGATALSKKKGRYDVRGKTARNGAGSFVVTAGLDRTLKRWNLPGTSDLEACAQSETEELPLEAFVSVRAHEKDINVVSVAPNDSLVASGSQDKSVKLWRATDLNLMATLKGHRRGVWDCQFSPYDRVLATASGDRSIRLWSLSDYSCVRTFQGHVASVLRVRFLNGGLQLLSSGADGLCKLWTIRTNECEATMDAHSDNVWALDVSSTGKTMISGGADSQLLVWRDKTEEAEELKHAQREESILMDQRLANHLRHKEFSQALGIALKLDKPRLALKVLASIVDADVKEKRNPISSLQQYIPSWSMERVSQVLHYCREWNTRARDSDVANLVIRAIVSVLPADDLAAAEGIPEVLAGVTPYAERHFERLDRLHTSSFLIDFALFAAGNIEEPREGEFSMWESQGRLVLPPTFVEGKIQVGGQAVVGGRAAALKDSQSDEEVSVVGDSDSSEDEGVSGNEERSEKGGSDSDGSDGSSES